MLHPTWRVSCLPREKKGVLPSCSSPVWRVCRAWWARAVGIVDFVGFLLPLWAAGGAGRCWECPGWCMALAQLPVQLAAAARTTPGSLCHPPWGDSRRKRVGTVWGHRVPQSKPSELKCHSCLASSQCHPHSPGDLVSPFAQEFVSQGLETEELLAAPCTHPHKTS